MKALKLTDSQLYTLHIVLASVKDTIDTGSRNDDESITANYEDYILTLDIYQK